MRQLPQSEWELLTPIFEQEGWTVPSPVNSAVYIEEDEHGVSGVAVISLVPHIEPIWVRPDRRGKGVFTRLLTFMTQALPNVNFAVATTTERRTERLLSHCQMIKQEGLSTFIWRKQ